MPIEISTSERLEVRDVTADVEAALPTDDAGTCTICCRHTTAAVVVNEADPPLLADIEQFLADIVPDAGWAHDDRDGNADSHLRAMLLGPTVTVPYRDGRLDLGTWQSLLFVECDGPRTRQLTVHP